MSAIQKYKKKAQELEKENEALREENKRLKEGRPVKEETPFEMNEDVFYKKSIELVNDIQHLMYESASLQLAASKIEYALLEAFRAGERSH